MVTIWTHGSDESGLVGMRVDESETWFGVVAEGMMEMFVEGGVVSGFGGSGSDELI